MGLQALCHKYYMLSLHRITWGHMMISGRGGRRRQPSYKAKEMIENSAKEQCQSGMLSKGLHE